MVNFKKVVMCAAAAVLAVLWTQALTPVQLQYVRARTRLVQRDTQSLPGYAINHFRRGGESWTATNRLEVANRQIALRLSKLELIIALKARGKWGAAKRFIEEAGFTDEWVACRWISTDYPLFISATNAAVRAGLATDRELQAVIKEASD